MWSNSVCLNPNGFVALRASRLSSNSLRAESETRDSSRSSFSWKLRLFRHGKPSKMMQNAIKYSGSIANLFCKCCLLCLNIMEILSTFCTFKIKGTCRSSESKDSTWNDQTSKPLKPLGCWSASSLLPVFCFLTGSLTGSLTGLVHNDSVTGQLLHLRDHCSHEFTFSMTRLEL